MKLSYALLVVSLVSTPAIGHEVAKGPNGGRVAEAEGLHVELVLKQSGVEVFLSDSKDQAVVPSGYKGTAILVVDGKAQRILLSPDQSRLVGQAPMSLAPDLKGVVQVTTPDGKTGTARFQ